MRKIESKYLGLVELQQGSVTQFGKINEWCRLMEWINDQNIKTDWSSLGEVINEELVTEASSVQKDVHGNEANGSHASTLPAKRVSRPKFLNDFKQWAEPIIYN